MCQLHECTGKQCARELWSETGPRSHAKATDEVLQRSEGSSLYSALILGTKRTWSKSLWPWASYLICLSFSFYNLEDWWNHFLPGMSGILKRYVCDSMLAYLERGWPTVGAGKARLL